MKREILFRGKCVRTGKWYFGYLSNKDVINQDKAPRIKVDPDSVGQFTGLTDKNGVKIFEGDICNHGTANLVVEFSNCSFWIGNLLAKFVIDHSNTLEVLGNIHDNPELI